MKTLTVIGRRWFQKTYGNTYHTAEVIVDTETIGKSDVTYGYDEHYLQTAQKMLEGKGLLPGLEHYAHGGSEALWRYCERNGIQFKSIPLDVQRRKDL